MWGGGKAVQSHQADVCDHAGVVDKERGSNMTAACAARST
jgi:hypothetical protein